jgi:hypothetical protein
VAGAVATQEEEQKQRLLQMKINSRMVTRKIRNRKSSIITQKNSRRNQNTMAKDARRRNRREEVLLLAENQVKGAEGREPARETRKRNPSTSPAVMLSPISVNLWGFQPQVPALYPTRAREITTMISSPRLRRKNLRKRSSVSRRTMT